MVERLAEMDAVFHALAHSARREMLDRLAGGERTVGELAAPFQMSLAAASKHVKVLEEAGLLRRAVRGRRHLCRLAPERLAEASAWLRFYERCWSERLDRLDAMFQPPATPRRRAHASRRRPAAPYHPGPSRGGVPRLDRTRPVAPWFGPDGFDVAEVELDLRPGGRHRTAVAGPDGLRGRFEGEYRELVPGRRIVTTWSWVAEGPGPEPEVSLLTVTLAGRRRPRRAWSGWRP